MVSEPSRGRILAGRYRLVRPLGAGAHGSVDLAEDLLHGGRPVAIKRVEGLLGAGDPEPASDRLRWFLHPRWAEIVDEGRLPDHGRFQVTRFVPGRSLDAVSGPCLIAEAWTLLEDGARVLSALHGLGLVHYDVTPGNLLREERPDGSVRFTLTDGGLANVGPVRGIARGTPQFMAPEVTEGRPHDHRVDLYSLGLVAWRLLVGRDPVEGGAGEVLGRRRREDAPLLRRVRPDVPSALEAVVHSLLAREPDARPESGHALLRRIADASGTPLRAVTDEEALALATGGALVGRTAEVLRFRRACRALLQSAGPAAGTTPAERLDPVLVAHGPPGSGGTRLVKEWAAVARAEDLAVLSLSGREGAADRRAPLRRVADALAGLSGADPFGGRIDDRGASREAHETRVVERFVDLCERTALRAPFVLVVEDFAELPAATQEALRVLARHLLSRAEHPDGRPQPRFLLAVDHGPEDPSSFRVPDAADPERPLVALAPFSAGDVRDFLASRLPGIEPPPADLATLSALSEGLPRVLASALAEGLRRGDARREGKGWVFDVDRAGTYAIDRDLSPAAARALAESSPAEREALARIALLDAPVPETVATRIADGAAVAHLASTPLLSVSREGGSTRFAVASEALAASLRSTAQRDRDATESRRRAVLTALDARPDPDVLAEHARLRVEAGDARGALSLLSCAAEDPPPAVTARLAAVLAAALGSVPAGLSDPCIRALAVRLLRPTGPAPAYVVPLRAALSGVTAERDLDSARLLAEHLLSTRTYAECAALAETVGDGPPSAHRAALLVAGCRARLSRNEPREARPLLSAALREERRLGALSRRRPESAEAHAVLACALARYRFVSGEYAKAAAAAGRAKRRAKRARAPSVLTQAYTALSVALRESGRPLEAERASERAIRLKTALGDVRGAAGNLHNLARMRQQRGAPLDAAAAFARVVSIGTRYADAEITSLALLSLADLYDEQGNVRLALTALERARDVCQAGGLRSRRLYCERSLAPLAAQAGEARQARAALLASARAARASRDPDARAAHFGTSALVSLHRGCVRKAAFLASRLPPAARLAAFSDLLTTLRAIGRPNLEGTCGRRLPRPAKAPEAVPFRRLLATALAARRAGGGSQALARRAVDRSLTPAAYGTSGQQFRLGTEVLFSVARRGGPEAALVKAPLDAVVKYAERSGLPVLAARAAALRFLGEWEAKEEAAASRSISAALAHLPPVGAAAGTGPEVGFALPDEVEAARAALSARFSGSTADPLTHLHALAHRLSLVAGPASPPDSRLPTALKTILTVAARLQTGGGLEALLESLNGYAREITGAERTCVVLLGPGNERTVEITSGAGTGGAEAAPVSHALIRRVLSTRTPILLHDVFGDSELMERPSITSMSLRSVLCVPMLRGSTLFGVMYADSSAGAGTFDKVDLEILSLFAEQAAAAIETSRLLADVQRSYSDLKAAQERLIRGERLRVMGEMTSGVAHDFNNLLTAILARIQLMNLGFVPPDLREGLHLIEKAALDAAEVVRRLQGFSRARREAGFTRVDVADLCADVVELLRPLWSGRRGQGRQPVAVRLRASSGLFVNGDPTELREVLTNLLKNALEALDGGGTVVLSAHVRDGRVHVEIQDDGPGIPPELQPKLFQPFFTTKGERGTGLGLCLSLQIAERHGGDLRLVSAGAGGTTAVLVLPQAPPDSLPAAAPGAPPAREQAPPPPSLAILVVDDDPDVRAPLCAYLERSGFEVSGVGTAMDGLVEAGRREPDLVITDIVMPGVDGIELCRRLKAIHPRVPVVLMSGQASAIDPSLIRDAGASALLAKPFTMRQILDLTASLTTRRSA